MKSQINFVKGSYHFHEDANFSFQLERLYSWGNGDLHEIQSAASRIIGIPSWVREISSLAEKAEAEDRKEQAASYYRMAEFFLFDGDQSKETFFKKSRQLFYEAKASYFDSERVKHGVVSWKNAKLPVLMATHQTDINKGSIVLHGGYDSLLEELFYMVLYFSEQGYDVYAFEGPGQGQVIREQKVPFLPEWESPVAAVLDHYNLTDVTLIGLSLGGMLAPRAAAFEKRIKRVVAWGVLPDFFDVFIQMLPEKDRKLVLLLLSMQEKELTNNYVSRLIDGKPLLQWAFSHGQNCIGRDNPYDLLTQLKKYTFLDVAEKIDQDFLQVGARYDHFVPENFSRKVLDALTNAKSVTYRIFTEQESAGDHCCVGNTKLVLDTIILWLAGLELV